MKHSNHTKHRVLRTGLLAAAVAVLLCGTALAVNTVIHMNTQPVGDYAVDITLENEAATEGAIFARPAVTATWLPEGMEAMPYEDNLKYQYADGSQGGITILPLGLDVDAGQVTLSYGFVTERDSLTVGGHDAFYLDNGQSYGQCLFVLYPDNMCVLEIMADEVARDDLIRFAEGLVLDFSPENGYMRTWSDWYGYRLEDETSYDDSFRYTATAEEMENLHEIGEEFPLYTPGGEAGLISNLTAKVLSVSLADDFSELDAAYIPDSWLDQLDANGKLKENTIEYFIFGDGINTLDELADTQQVTQKVLIADVEYKNTGDSTYRGIFTGGIMKLTATDSGVAIYDRAVAAGYDYLSTTGARGMNLEMEYYNVRNTENSNGGNVLNAMEPGETQTVRMAWLVNEDELDMLYLNLNIVNQGIYSISDDDLAAGYVDIRQ